MSAIPNADRDADELLRDAGDDEIDEWTLDDLGFSTDLASIRQTRTPGNSWRGLGDE